VSRSSSRLPPLRGAAKSRTGLFVGLGGGFVILVLLAILLSPDQPVALSEFGTVTISGDSLAPFSGDTSGDAATGSRAPEVSGVDFDGMPISISSKGRPIVILFLAHWCPHCQREVPAIGRYLIDNDFPENVEFISVATASSRDRPNWPPSAWLSREGWSLPTLVDDETSSAFRAFGQGGFPYYVFIDRNGFVAHRLSGEQEPDHLADLMQWLADLP